MFYDIFLELCAKSQKKPGRVAEDCGLSRASVNRWKGGSTPTYETIKVLADYFDVSTDFLLGKEKSPATANSDKAEISDEILDLAKVIADLPPEKKKMMLDLIDLLKDGKDAP